MRDFVNVPAKELGIVVTWKGEDVDKKSCNTAGKCIVAVDPRYFRSTEVETLLGNASKACIKFGWKPKTIFDELLLAMVREDLKSLGRDEMEKRCGYVVSKNYEFTSGFKGPKKLLMFARK